MTPPRLILLLLCFIALPTFLTFFSLLYSHPRHQVDTESGPPTPKGGVRAFFSFHTPASLFPPSAIISLTDDNSTFFLARPAAFGSLLPANGLSGQLWVGSGFGDDSLRRGGAVTGAEGELGCTDVPGWGGGNERYGGDNSGEGAAKRKNVMHQDYQAATSEVTDGKQRRSDGSGNINHLQDNGGETAPSEDDGTDDHLHHPLPDSYLSKPSKLGQLAPHDTSTYGQPPGHADIQSLQESAEIAGKVVLLSRGGCGFLEKAKWVQRRGGMALIVGDDTRGGPLVTMYGRGDASNVTIPALFTSHTTAHLLSSLIPPGGTVEDRPSDDVSKPGSGDARTGRNKKKTTKKNKTANEGPTFTPAFGGTKPTGIARPSIVPLKRFSSVRPDTSASIQQKRSWFRSIGSSFGLGGGSDSSGVPADSRRPPSSGRINWVISDTWTDEPSNPTQNKELPQTAKKPDRKSKSAPTTGSQLSSGDDFIIGIQDWRDPDLVVGKASVVKDKGKSETTVVKAATPTSSPAGKHASTSSDLNEGKLLAGGSITPGSGEYEQPIDEAASSQHSQSGKDQASLRKSSGQNEDQSQNWLGGLLWDHGSKSLSSDGEGETLERYKKPAKFEMEDFYPEEEDEKSQFFDDRDGLWVTLQPTTMSTSPFVDTLLVLVVSPLVTLTVVYALLLLRSRIRRRRWRAPKSVVDRLPVRTYHTMSCSSSSSSSHLESPVASSPTSPLLQTSPRSTLPRSRPRSRTTSGIGETVSNSLSKATANTSLLQRGQVAGNPPEKKKYSGKQVECVVCLEEYVDGQSRVMSLPCGHEFHAECM